MSIFSFYKKNTYSTLTFNFCTFIKILTIFIVNILVFISVPNTYAIGALESSYFDNSILLESNTFAETVNTINIGNYSFSTNQEQKRYLNTKRFFQTVKADMRERFKKNNISTYKATDMIEELRFISYYLDQYFRNIQSFEKTGNTTYKNIAKDNLLKAERGYRNLTIITTGIKSSSNFNKK